MAINKKLQLCFIIYILLVCIQANDCNQTDALKGCTSCINGSTQVLNSSSNLFVCVQITDCQIVDSEGNCVKCLNGAVLNITISTDNATNATNTTYTCIYSSQSGCKTLLNGNCTECISSNYALNSSSGICQLIIYDYCWKADITGCTQCSDQNIVSTSNCSISSTICALFDYQKWLCSSCPSNLMLHSSSIFCYNSTSMTNCLVISVSGCVECNFGYYINSSSNQCVLDQNYTLQFELLPTAYYIDKSTAKVRICLDINSAFNSTSMVCENVGNSYCRTVTNNECTACVDSFYLVDTKCYPCSSNYAQCIICDAYNCKQCYPTYFLVIQSNTYNITQILVENNVTEAVTQCMPCSIYGCYYCRSQFDTRGIFSVRCDVCLFGFKLHNHTCIKCSSGSYYSLTQKVCATCPITNCIYCNSNQLYCQQCIGTLYFNSISNICEEISLVLSTNALNKTNAKQILNKSMPLSSTRIINDQKLLMTNCAGSSNGFSCICNNSGTYTSLCYPLSTTLLSNTLNIGLFNLASTNFSTAYFQQNEALLLLLSELPTYSWNYAPSSTQLISNLQFASYLQITTNYIRNHVQKTSSSISAISNLVFNQLYKTFDPYQPTILSGPGYYFKYTPANPSKDDSTVVSLSQNTVASVVFIYFNNTIDSTVARLTGTTYVFLNQTSTQQLNLKLKKISFLGNNQNYIVISNGNQLSLGVSSDSEGFVTISAITASNNSTVNSYFVSSTSSGGNNSASFANQRIQNLIYKVAFIYILIFLVLYLTLIPFCALFDCVDKKSIKRKIKSEEDETYQGIKHRSGSQLQEQIALKINYKDFFPIYNIANTQRPKRLLKLCLFLVNSQHSITFLTLVYFNLSGGQSLVAVLLAIPAYLCTLILGYLCGLFILKIPGHFKYLINLVTLGYWILWVPLMSNFRSFQYAPYVFTFAIIFFFIDMLIDFLQTLLMYFTIKQQSRQIKLFKALSKWLSYRGYYQFDKMAKQIDEVRDNAV